VATWHRPHTAVGVDRFLRLLRIVCWIMSDALDRFQLVLPRRNAFASRSLSSNPHQHTRRPVAPGSVARAAGAKRHLPAQRKVLTMPRPHAGQHLVSNRRRHPPRQWPRDAFPARKAPDPVRMEKSASSTALPAVRVARDSTRHSGDPDPSAALASCGHGAPVPGNNRLVIRRLNFVECGKIA
jgi:hypothetical protein